MEEAAALSVKEALALSVKEAAALSVEEAASLSVKEVKWRRPRRLGYSRLRGCHTPWRCASGPSPIACR